MTFTRALISTLSVALLAVSCAKPKNLPQVFFGKCKMDIEAPGKHTEIRVDGITVGYEKVSVNVPCGEKRITVLKSGLGTYEKIHLVSLGKPAKILVKLEKLHVEENFALSRKLVAQARTGQKIDMKAEVIAIKDPEPLVASSSGTSTTSSGSSATSATTSNLNPDGSCAKWCNTSDWL